MGQPSLLILAKNGDSGAIAAYLSYLLATAQIQVGADWQGGILNLRFEAASTPDAETLTTFARQQLRQLQIEKVDRVRLFGYQIGHPAPLWNRWIDIADSASETALPDPGIFPEGLSLARNGTTPASDAAFPEDSSSVDRFLVCGLGSLGQYCIFNLKRFALREFEVQITAIEKHLPGEWEVPNVLDYLAEELIIGDCCNDQTLLQAGVKACRAILLVTSNESVNIEAAIAARRLNPQIRLIVRSSRHSLNELLKHQLGNFVALDPSELPAPAFALAGLQTGILGFFDVGNWRFQIVEQQVQAKDPRFDGLPAHLLHKQRYRLLSHLPLGQPPSDTGFPTPARAFYQWQPDTRIQMGDAIAFIEVVDQAPKKPANHSNHPRQWLQQQLDNLRWQRLKQSFGRFWRWLNISQTRQIISVGLLTALLLWAFATVMFLHMVPHVNLQRAMSAAVILLLGGYGDVFGGDLLSQEASDQVPGWVRLVSLGINLVSILFVLGVLGLIAENVLSSRFEFLAKRPPIPQKDHVVLVGLGRVGQRVATLLQGFRQPLVALTETLDNRDLLRQFPIILGNPMENLDQVNLATARSVIVVTDDQMVNLEIGLMARDAAINAGREIGLVVRTYDQRFSDNLDTLLPKTRIMAAYALSGEAFAGAAFGENILGLFRLNNQNILVTEYVIAPNDTLVGKLLAQVAYGYGVMPVLHQQFHPVITEDPLEALLPDDDRRLQVGDRLVVLASINGLRRIERGDLALPGRWLLEVKPTLNTALLHYGGNDLARISGCDLEVARTFMNTLPNRMELDLYDYQAYSLQQELGRSLQIRLTPF
jgi:Trk K+ transport system NAD-binding subunit